MSLIIFINFIFHLVVVNYPFLIYWGTDWKFVMHYLYTIMSRYIYEYVLHKLTSYTIVIYLV